MIRDEKEILGFFEKQLEQLGVEYVDYYWLHGLNAQTYRQAEEMHAFDFIQTKKAEGKIHHRRGYSLQRRLSCSVWHKAYKCRDGSHVRRFACGC